MKEIETRWAKLIRWIEYGWLLVSNPTFRAAHDKRRAYYEYRLSKIYNAPCL